MGGFAGILGGVGKALASPMAQKLGQAAGKVGTQLSPGLQPAQSNDMAMQGPQNTMGPTQSSSPVQGLGQGLANIRQALALRQSRLNPTSIGAPQNLGIGSGNGIPNPSQGYGPESVRVGP